MANQRDVVTTVITNDMGCVVEVRKCADLVRCKDCKHYLNEHICMYFSRHGTIETSSDDYCSHGERRGL